MSKAKELIESLSVFSETEEVVEKSGDYEVVKSGEHNTHLVKHNGNVVGSVQKHPSGHKASVKEGRHWRLDTKNFSTHEKAVEAIKQHHQGKSMI